MNQSLKHREAQRECIHQLTNQTPHLFQIDFKFDPKKSTVELPFYGPRILLNAFPLNGKTRFFFFIWRKFDFLKRLGVATYFLFYFSREKQNKKEKPLVWPLPDPFGWHDSLSLFLKSSVEWNGKVVFEFWKIRPRWGTVLFGVATYFLFLFFKGEKLSKNKNPWWL